MQKFCAIIMTLLCLISISGCTADKNVWPGVEYSEIPGYGDFDKQTDTVIENYVSYLQEVDKALENSDNKNISTFSLSDKGQLLQNQFGINVYGDICMKIYLTQAPDTFTALTNLATKIASVSGCIYNTDNIVKKYGEQYWFNELNTAVAESKDYLTTGKYLN